MTTDKISPMDGWNIIPWKKMERNVFKLQKRIYQASQRGDIKTVRQLQRLLLKSQSTKLLAVRKVSQDNQGKKTAGVDGVKSLTPTQRLALAETLIIGQKAQPVRRVWIPKAGTDEQRPLGIPTLANRAGQALVKLVLEPEWEARFEPNSYGFRPGRSCHDAIEAIFTAIAHKPKYVLDADIAKCFDRIDQTALLNKVNTSPGLRRQLKAWLKAGVLENEEWYPTEEGTMQGGIISPLLANVALHGLETAILNRFPRSNSRGFNPPNIIKYADDFVILHADLEIIKQCQTITTDWLEEVGLELKPSKTRITHTLSVAEGKPGFDFLGFNIRQYPVGKTKSGKDCRGRLHGFKTHIKPSKEAIERHVIKLRETFKQYRHAPQAALIKALNPIIIGWSNYYAYGVSAQVFKYLDNVVYSMLWGWANYRHPKKNKHWIARKYWRVDDGQGWIFRPPEGGRSLARHAKTKLKRYIKVQGRRSPYDGDWVYWSKRLGRHPQVASRMAKLLKRQQGKCQECGLYFTTDQKIEIDHIVPKEKGGTDALDNLQLLHRHCHNVKTTRDRYLRGTDDKRQVTEEPCEDKSSRTVLKPSLGW